ncbi:hypothetical protein [Roseibaca sp. Y0-43]|uniref:hypothetical protein n=1 Tax=Roseibaca sp. Y0-43 TaxID=2816854 RepID=UPI001D0C37C6|nr:hypothetical protein [Roseibaca sp. Y0-43]MCC1480899.1 hypothetical protein [Roseibaca sp. Y0-43]
MSQIPPISGASSSALPPRDPVALAAMSGPRGPAPVSATLTQAAVQQAKAASRTDLAGQRDTLPVPDKRDRLVGPPPTFEVNVLQHMRETRNDPPDLSEIQEESEAPLPAPEVEGYRNVSRMDSEKDQPPALDTHA